MAAAWTSFAADFDKHAYEFFDIQETSPEQGWGGLMQCISDSMRTGFSAKEDFQYFFKRCFGRILQDFEAFNAEAWSDRQLHLGLIGLDPGTPRLQETEQKWLFNFMPLVCEPVKPITISSASLKARL